jgi:hypothetical protein
MWRLAVALFLIVTGCVQQLQLRTAYTASVEITGDQPDDIVITPGGEIRYADTRICAVQAGSQQTRAWQQYERPPVLPLRIRNTSSAIVTIDWDHSVFVDGTGSSYRLFTTDSDKTPVGVETVKKPPSPVIAPDAHLDVVVYPEPRDWTKPIFWAPLKRGESRDFRIVLATADTSRPVTEAAFRAVLLQAQENREPSGGALWPKEGATCLPLVGCASGFDCTEGNVCRRAADAGSRTSGREVSAFGGRCEVDADCLNTLTCQSGRCKQPVR